MYRERQVFLLLWSSRTSWDWDNLHVYLCFNIMRHRNITKIVNTYMWHYFWSPNPLFDAIVMRYQEANYFYVTNRQHSPLGYEISKKCFLFNFHLFFDNFYHFHKFLARLLNIFMRFIIKCYVSDYLIFKYVCMNV